MPTTYPDPIVNPLLPPTVSGTTYTVDFLLNNPTRVNAVVADLTMSNFFLNTVFSTGGDVQGGAVLYDQANYLDTYTDRDVERIEPGAEAPIVGGVRTGPYVAAVEKFGGKFATTAEARRRNQVGTYNNQLRRLANTIVRKMHQRGIATLDAAISAYTRTGAGLSWGDAIGVSALNITPAEEPTADFAAILAALENLEMGYSYDTLIVNPQEAKFLRILYKNELRAVLSDNGITNFIVTPRQTAGSAKVLAGGQVGEMRLEEPLRTTTADELTSAPSLVEQTWTQSLVNPVFFVTDPYALFELTGLAA